MSYRKRHDFSFLPRRFRPNISDIDISSRLKGKTGEYDSDTKKVTIHPSHLTKKTMTHEAGHRTFWEILTKQQRQEWYDFIRRQGDTRSIVLAEEEFADAFTRAMGVYDDTRSPYYASSVRLVKRLLNIR